MKTISLILAFSLGAGIGFTSGMDYSEQEQNDVGTRSDSDLILSCPGDVGGRFDSSRNTIVYETNGPQDYEKAIG